MFCLHQCVPTHLFSSHSNCIPLVSQYYSLFPVFGTGLLRKGVRTSWMLTWILEINTLAWFTNSQNWSNGKIGPRDKGTGLPHHKVLEHWDILFQNFQTYPQREVITVSWFYHKPLTHNCPLFSDNTFTEAIIIDRTRVTLFSYKEGSNHCNRDFSQAYFSTLNFMPWMGRQKSLPSSRTNFVSSETVSEGWYKVHEKQDLKAV